jgi:ADP-ribose pyrophosphatase YjhB (NUDIX family)
MSCWCYDLVGKIAIAIIVWRIALSIYRRFIMKAKNPKSYGKWAIVTGFVECVDNNFNK